MLLLIVGPILVGAACGSGQSDSLDTGVEEVSEDTDGSTDTFELDTRILTDTTTADGTGDGDTADNDSADVEDVTTNSDTIEGDADDADSVTDSDASQAANGKSTYTSFAPALQLLLH